MVRLLLGFGFLVQRDAVYFGCLNDAMAIEHRLGWSGAFYFHAGFQFQGGCAVRLDVEKVARVENGSVWFAVERVIQMLHLAGEVAVVAVQTDEAEDGMAGMAMGFFGFDFGFQFFSFRRQGCYFGCKFGAEVDLNDFAIGFEQESFRGAFGADVEGLNDSSFFHTCEWGARPRPNGSPWRFKGATLSKCAETVQGLRISNRVE